MTNQLTLLLLVVVISGALCTVEDYVIMSQCAHNKAIYLAAEGTVSVTDISQTQNITIVGRPDFVNNNFKIALYAKETQRYLCFNDHWKLVGMKELQDTCYFNEAIVHGYFVFRSVVDLQRRIGFTQRGRAVGPKKTVNDACYMFTKIPTDQFFHQHQHISTLSVATRKRPSTTRAPKTLEHSGGGGGGAHLGGRGSGGGRLKPNRHRNQHRSSEEMEHGGGHKKTKGHGNSRKRQHQQRLQQIRGGHGGGSGHSLSDPKNSTYLNSSRQNNVELSQYGGHNHTGKHHNHSQPQYHQTRHHHSDSRRHHHESKQKSRNHHRARASPSPASYTTTVATTTTSTSEQTTAVVTSTKPKLASSSEYAEIKPTSVVQPSSTVITATTTTATNHDVLATSVAHKRKGRRRKPHRKHTFHKSEQLNESSGGGSHSGEKKHGKHNHGVSHATLPSYDDEEYMTTDYTTWISNNDMSPPMGLPSAVKPTSASLPTWENWYPSASTPLVVEETSADYSSTLLGSYEKEDTSLSTLSTSSLSSALPSHYDISKNPLPLMPLPLPTSAFFSSTLLQSDNNINDSDGVAISPTTVVMMTDLGAAKTINTSTFSETETWSTRKQQHEEDEVYLATPKLSEDVINITDHNHNVVAEDFENATPTTTSASDELTDDSFEMAAGSTVVTTPKTDEFGAALHVTPTKSTEPHAPSTKIQDASTVSGSKLMTDYIYATRTAPPITSNHKVSRHRHGDHHSHDNQQKHQHNAMQQPPPHHTNGDGVQKQKHHKSSAVTSRDFSSTTAATSSTTTASSLPTAQLAEAGPTLNYQQMLQLDALLAADKNVNTKQSHNTVSDTDTETSESQASQNHSDAFSAPTYSSTITSAVAASTSLTSPSPSVATSSTTRKTLRKSTQRLLATPFHQLTYVRNEAGDIDIDSLDNISIYPDLLDNDNVNDDDLHKSGGGGPGGSSRFTMISGYLPTSATATLPESIRIAKIKINRERKRMLRLRNVGGYNA